MVRLALEFPIERVTEILDLADRILCPDTFFRFRSKVIPRWAESDPLAALNHVQTAKPALVRVNFVEAILTQWARQDPEAAMGWVESQAGNSARRESYLQWILGSTAESNPELSLAMLEKLGPKFNQKARDRRFKKQILYHNKTGYLF